MIDRADSVTVLKGIGEKKKAILSEMGINTVEDLLSYYPKCYKERILRKNLSDCKNHEKILIEAAFTGKISTQFYQKNKNRTTAIFNCANQLFPVIFYNQPYLKNSLQNAKFCLIYGTVLIKNGAVSIQSIQLEKKNNENYLKPGIYPYYSLPQKCPITQKQFCGYISDALSSIKSIPEILPPMVIEGLDLPNRMEALEKIHHPGSLRAAEEGLSYSKAYEFLKFQASIEKRILKKHKTKAAVLSHESVQSFIDSLPFTLTDSQKKAVNDIQKDFQRGIQMQRLLQGDVGSGKTAVAAISSFIALTNNKQVAFTAPTEILARQHYQKYCPLFKNFGFKSGFLSSSLKQSERKCLLDNLRNGDIHILFGTHALFSKDVLYKDLSLIIIDEQHRYGVSQRAEFEEKGHNPHVLVMSATPIPRTLALSIYKDLDLSILTEKPPGRKTIQTKIITSYSLPTIYSLIRKNAENGYKSYIVCPAIDDDEMQNVKSEYDYVKKYMLPFKTEYLTGEMKDEDKEKIMCRFALKDSMVLVATSLIEVGIDVKEATIMLIKDSDRFGASQLHQLRGRVGRGSTKSICFLHTDKESENTVKRLKILSSTDDGFKIAKEDLKLRGSGDIFGYRQSGKQPSLILDIQNYEELYRKSERIYAILSNSKDEQNIQFLVSLKEQDSEKKPFTLN